MLEHDNGASPVDADDLALLESLAEEAGAIAFGYFGKDPDVWMKEGQSPVSEADLAVDGFLKEKLLAERPDYGWLSEETEDTGNRLDSRRVFVVDPIDGTRGFINGMKRWCVSIAVVEDNRPVAGVLECPAMKQRIVARAGAGVFVNGQQVTSHPPGDVVRIIGPRSIGKSVDNDLPAETDMRPFVPSLAYRLAMIALDEADLAIARASARDWDLAAADLIVAEAGARLTGLDGHAVSYNCRDVRHGALVAAHNSRHDEMLDLAAKAINKDNT